MTTFMRPRTFKADDISLAQRKDDAPPVVRVQNLTKVYAHAMTAVDDLSLEIRCGELVCLLGPSGCGKSTTLQMIAGFTTPTAGSIHINGQNVTMLPPHRRDTGMVFQSYALFPHMTISANVEFGMRNVGVPTAERRSKTAELLNLVELGHLAHRKPGELSGGQQQRVALARALAVNPAVLLLDEPFSNLDAQLRVRLRADLRRLIVKLKLTTIFVTHDQEEALSLSDRIVVLNRGKVEQIGSPREIYDAPRNAFIAQFVGHCTLLPGIVTGERFFAGGQFEVAARGYPDGPASAVIRPEQLRVAGSGDAGHRLKGRVLSEEFIGSSTRMDVEIDGSRFILEDRSPNRAILRDREMIEVVFDESRIHFVERPTNGRA
jgi:putative spermidine/putrescine transport system ATP-binding protein